MIQSSACQPWRVDPPGLAGEHGGLVGTYTISWDTIVLRPDIHEALATERPLPVPISIQSLSALAGATSAGPSYRSLIT